MVSFLGNLNLAFLSSSQLLDAGIFINQLELIWGPGFEDYVLMSSLRGQHLVVEYIQHYSNPRQI